MEFIILEITEIIKSFGELVLEFFPIIIFAVLIASLLSTMKWDKKIAHLLKKSKGWSIILAILFGIASPL